MKKFRNVKTDTVFEGETVKADSKLEAARLQELALLQKAGHLSELKYHVPFKLIVNDLLVATYIADFTYYDKEGVYIVEDTKGFVTPEFKLKQKLMLACHGIDILLTFASNKAKRKSRKAKGGKA